MELERMHQVVQFGAVLEVDMVQDSRFADDCRGLGCLRIWKLGRDQHFLKLAFLLEFL